MKTNTTFAKQIKSAVNALKAFEGTPLACVNRVKAAVKAEAEYSEPIVDLFVAAYESVRTQPTQAAKKAQIVKILNGFTIDTLVSNTPYTLVDGRKMAVNVHKVGGKYYFTVRTMWTPTNILEIVGSKYDVEEIPADLIITEDELKELKDAEKADKKAAKEDKGGKGLTSLDAALDFIAGCSADDFIKVMKAVQARNAKA
jgi:hypothetical protein